MASAGLLHPQIDVDPRDPGIKDLIRNGQYQLSDDGQPLDPMAKLSNTWPGQPHDDRLHVFVSLPAADSPTIDYDGGECFIRRFASAQNI